MIFRPRGGLLLALLTLVSVAQAKEPASAPTPVDALLEKYEIKESAVPIREDARYRAPKSIVIFVPKFLPRPVENFEPWIRAAAPDARVEFVSDRASFSQWAATADVAILGNCNWLDKGMSNLRWVQRLAVGAEVCLKQQLEWKDRVLLTNSAGLSGPFIAEHAITMTLMLTHAMPYFYRNQLEQSWRRSRRDLTNVRSVEGATLLVVGLGGIGVKVAEKASQLGMRVIATRNSSREGPDFVEYVGRSSELVDLLGKADFVISTLPLTPNTRGLFDAMAFAAMKPTAHFVNVGRGGTVVTDDLVQALQHGVIAGAGLDVVNPEPLPSSHPLWLMPNVIITPHSSGVSGLSSPDVLVLIRENVRRYAQGEKMLNVVDPARGY